MVAAKFLPRPKEEITAGAGGQEHTRRLLDRRLNPWVGYVDLYSRHMWDYQTPFCYIEGAPRAVDLALTAEECARPEELYTPHPFVGVMVQNVASAAKDNHVWSMGNQKVQITNNRHPP